MNTKSYFTKHYNNSTFIETFNSSKVILTEGSLAQRLKSEFNAEFDESVAHSGLIYSDPKLIRSVYEQYLDIGKKNDLPIFITTPTRNVNYETIAKSRFKGKDILSDSVKLLKEIRLGYGDYSNKVFIGGMIGCKGDAYSGDNHLNAADSYNFHRHQILLLKKKQPDFLLGTLMPEINEAIGMAKAMSETEIPYIISFMIRKDGRLLDKTPLYKAIRLIDSSVSPKPLCYITNCIHPTNLLSAICSEINQNKKEMSRLVGIQANASTLSPEELDNCTITQKSDYSNMINDMNILYNKHKFKIFGGCCGTDDSFIEKLSAGLITKL